MPAEPTKPAADAPAPEPTPAALMPAPATPLQVQSPNPLPQPAAGEPAMGMGRLRAYRANPTSKDAEAYARELVERCGPLVLDGVQYRIRDGRFESVTVEQLAVERMRQQTSKDEIETPELGPGA
jgi:hypothetical protein